MSRSSNSLRVSDVVTTPIKLKYTSSYDCSTAAQAGITVYDGVNGDISVTGSVPFETLVYRSIQQLYYSNYLTGSKSTDVYSGSYLTTTSSFDNSLQSTAAFGTLDADVRNFPTGSGARIRVLSIPRLVFGEKISRQGFLTSGSAVIIDDGNGNLIDVSSLPYVQHRFYAPEYTDWYAYGPVIHVGNIFYRQGMAVITNPDYFGIFPVRPLAVSDTATFITTTTPKIVNILANDVANTGTLVPSSVKLSGPSSSLFTNNLNGTVTLNTTIPGTYSALYTVDSTFAGGCGLTSNTASVTVTVQLPPCSCTTYRVTHIVGGSDTFTYEVCGTRTIASVTLTGINDTIEVCSCSGRISALTNRTRFSVTRVGSGCTADCNLAGNVVVV
jgi:hypothetical protein